MIQRLLLQLIAAGLCRFGDTMPDADAGPGWFSVLPADARSRLPPSAGAGADTSWDLRRRRRECPGLDPAAWPQRPGCAQPIFFLGSMKQGSTGMACLLKGMGPACAEPAAWYACAAGKEVAWGRQPSGQFGADAAARWLRQFGGCAGRQMGGCADPWQRAFAIDGGGLHLDAEVKRVACAFPAARWVMMVRDPVEVATSFLNDELRRFGASLGQVESGFAEMTATLRRGAKAGQKWGARPSMAERGLALMRHAEQLRVFLAYFPPEQLLVVHTGALSTRLPALRDALERHTGIPIPKPAVEPAAEIRANALSALPGYFVPPEAQRLELASQLRASNEAFFSTVGVRLPWAKGSTANASPAGAAAPARQPPRALAAALVATLAATLALVLAAARACCRGRACAARAVAILGWPRMPTA